MIVLGIETSIAEGTIALIEDDVLRAERTLQSDGARHAQTLVRELRDLFDNCGVRPEACDLVAVSSGPGSFTGLRIGVVAAKTMAYALGCKLAGVPTLLTIAREVPAEYSLIEVVMDAHREQVFWAEFLRDNANIWRESQSVRTRDADEWISSLTGQSVVTGSGLEKYGDAVRGRCWILDQKFWPPRARNVARIAREHPDLLIDPWRLVPNYYRKSAAEEKWELTHPPS